MNRFIISLIPFICLFSHQLSAQELPIQSKLPSLEQLERAEKHNAEQSARQPLRSLKPQEQVFRPFADHETVGSVFFSVENQGESEKVKREILSHLPEDVKIHFYYPTEYADMVKSALDSFSDFFDLTKVKSLSTVRRGSTSFWARDAIPVPVFLADGRVGGVDAKYYHNYEPDKTIGRQLELPILELGYYNEGGNFLADTAGNCLMVNNERVQRMSDDLIREYYGCSQIHRFRHISGIGHIDERVKIISDRVVFTDQQEYVSQLERIGYEVKLLPGRQPRYETYANSLMVNGTVILPIFRVEADQKAIRMYEDEGFKVVPVYVNQLPNSALGSIHCMTMTYPPIANQQ